MTELNNNFDDFDGLKTIELVGVANSLDIGLSSVIGKRKEQQDTVMADDEYMYYEKGRAIATLCDGMGGLNGGKQASLTCASLLNNAFHNIDIDDDISTFYRRIVQKLDSSVKGLKNDDGTYDVGYTLDTPAVSKIKITDNALLRNKELEQGDYVKVDGTIIDFDETTNKNRTYEVNEISITKKSDYEKRLLDELKGKDYLSTAIVSHYESESQYDGYAICQVFIGDNMDTPDGLIKVYYDFYNGETQSYLGNADSPIETNYGVLDYEIVTVHFKEKVSDLNNIHAKTFEFIAD